MVTKMREAPERGSASVSWSERSLDLHGALDSDFPVSISLLRRNLLLFTALKTIGSFDSGAFSAVLGAENGLAEEWNLGTVQQGTLTSSVFLGNIIGCPLSGHLFSRYSAKMVLVWSLILNIFVTFLFATLKDYFIAILCRFLIGITLSFVIIYTPVWVDEFAPRERQSMWMASHNAGVPLGIMLGYSLGAFLPSYMAISWEWAFYIKCIFTIPALGCVARSDRRSIDAQSEASCRSNVVFADTTQSKEFPTKRIFDILHSNFLYLWHTCAPLFRSLEYVCSTLSMCSLYFVVTGLQNFVTQYLREDPFNASMKTIMLGFGGAVVTAPVIGVLTGGVLLDRIGGYECNLLRVTSFTCAWGAAAAAFSILCIFVTDTMTFLLVISIVLFCGGAIIPPGSGTVMASVPDQLRPAGAALSQMMYNLLGNFSGPLVCGFVAEWTGELKYGIYTVLCCSVLGLIPMLVLLKVAHTKVEPSISASTSSLRPALLVHRSENNADVESKSGDVGPVGLESPRIVALEDLCVLSLNEGSVPANVGITPPWPVSHLSPNQHLSPALHLDSSVPNAHVPKVTFVVSPESAKESTPEYNRSCEVEMPSEACWYSLDENDGRNEGSLRIGTDAAQMMSFPSQHSFGLDMLRSLLSGTSRRRPSSSRGSLDNTENVQCDSLELTRNEDVRNL